MILVTGAYGIVGRDISNRLKSMGIPVIAMGRNELDLARSELAEGSTKPEAIIHLAALVPPRQADSALNADLTRAIDRNVFRAAQMWDVPVVYASTCSLYGRDLASKKVESAPLSGIGSSPYRQAKADGEKLFGTLEDITILRVPSPLSSAIPSSLVAKRFMETAMRDGCISVWGKGTRQQNFLAVSDISSAFVLAATSRVGGVFNICADQPTTMAELADATVNACGKGRWEFSRRSDPQEGEHADYSNVAARRMLGWSPRRNLKDSLKLMRETWNSA